MISTCIALLATQGTPMVAPRGKQNELRLVVKTGGAKFLGGKPSFDESGKLLLSSGGETVLWDRASRRQIRSFPGTSGSCAIFVPTTGWIVSTGVNDSILLLDRKTGVVIRSLRDGVKRSMNYGVPDDDAVFDLKASSNGKFVIALFRHSPPQIWSLADDQTWSLPIPKDSAQSIAISPTADFFFISTLEGLVQQWSFNENRIIRALHGVAGVGHFQLSSEGKPFQGGVGNLQVSSDGKLLAGVSHDWRVLVWKLNRKEIGFKSYIANEKPSFKDESGRLKIAFRPNTHILAVLLDDLSQKDTLKHIDAESGEVIDGFGGQGLDHDLEYDPDGNCLAISCDPNGTAFWNEIERSFEHPGIFTTLNGPYEPIFFGQHGSLIATVGEQNGDKVLVWDFEKGFEAARLNTGTYLDSSNAAFSEDGRLARIVPWTEFPNLRGLVETEVVAISGGAAKEEEPLPLPKDLKGYLPEALCGLRTGLLAVCLAYDPKPEEPSRPSFIVVYNSRLEAVARVQLTDSLPHSSVWMEFTFDGSQVFVHSLRRATNGAYDGVQEVIDVRGQRILQSPGVDIQRMLSRQIVYSPDNKRVAVILQGEIENRVRVLDSKSWMPLPGPDFKGRILNLAWSLDGLFLAIGSSEQIHFYESGSWREALPTLGATGRAMFLPDGRQILIANESGIELWDFKERKLLCNIISFEKGVWAVTTPDGLFDTNKPDELRDMHWVASDAPFTPLPIEIFTRDYYEPGLLAKIWRGEKLRPVRSLVNLDRAQPSLEVKAEIQGDEASVTVVAGKGTAELERDGKKVVQVGLPQDVRLFLDGKLIGYEDGPVGLDAQERWTKSYKIPLPRNGEKAVEVSAYCFNQDRVKSETARQTLKLDLPKRQGKAYVISVGVDRYARKDLSLNYAAADATTISGALKARLAGYSDVVTVPLLSDDGHHDATKVKFHAVLDALAGKKADLTGVPNGDKLAKSTPEDLVVISWSGHGLSSKAGEFYLLPEDVRDDPDTYGKPFLASCVSTDDLTAWLRDVRAADMALIVDACHSAAVVQSAEFKPGPLGNRGLGQLAYDKGIRVLAATQVENVALESDKLGNGLLTYALVHDGLGEGKAPTLKAWLAGAVDDVPRLYEALAKGTLRAARAVPATEGVGPERDFRQRPALFDYTRSESHVPFVGGH